MFEIRYKFVHEGKHSRDYLRARSCVREGAKIVERKWDAKYRVGVVGQNLGMPREFEAAVDRARFLLRERPIGTTVVIQRLRSDNNSPAETVKFRKVTVRPPVANTEGVEGIDRAVGWIEANKKRSDRVRYAGICVCKPDSDHADCAALDIFATDSFMRRMKAEFLANPSWYHTKYVILYREICFPAPGRCGPYFGVFHAHVHLSVNGGHPNAAC